MKQSPLPRLLLCCVAASFITYLCWWGGATSSRYDDLVSICCLYSNLKPRMQPDKISLQKGRQGCPFYPAEALSKRACSRRHSGHLHIFRFRSRVSSQFRVFPSVWNWGKCVLCLHPPAGNPSSHAMRHVSTQKP